MGLDITYYRKIKKLDCVFDADGEPIHPATRQPIERDHFRAYSNPDFPDRAEGLESGAVYTHDKDCGGFRAGSYSGYNHWREQLSEMAGYPKAPYKRFESQPAEMRHDIGAIEAEKGPFFELICFSDCEGDIGAAVSSKLAKDFQEFQPKADAHPDEWFRTKYAEWRTAFETASDNGCVRFH